VPSAVHVAASYALCKLILLIVIMGINSAAHYNLRHVAVQIDVVTYPKSVYTASFGQGAHVPIGWGGWKPLVIISLYSYFSSYVIV